MKTFTPKNLPDLVIPLTNLKGKDYMLVAHRLLWFVNDVKCYSITSNFFERTETAATCHVTVEILNEEGRVTRRAQSTKRETKADFNDFTEKAETGALGRALASLGYGTAQALSDLEENMRLADAPLPSVSNTIVAESAKDVTSPAPVRITTSFAKKKGASASSNVVPISKEPVAAVAVSTDDEWK
jgi:hypothetical protein